MRQEPLSVDRLDIAILSHLARDGRASFAETARALSVSVGTVRNRYKSLVDSKVLSVYGRVNPRLVGLAIYARIEISVEPAAAVLPVAEQLADLPETAFIALVSGDFNLEWNVMCQDNDHFARLLANNVNTSTVIVRTRTGIYHNVLKVGQPVLNLLIKRQEEVQGEDEEVSGGMGFKDEGAPLHELAKG